MFPVDSILQAATLTFSLLLVVFLLVFSALLSGSSKKKKSIEAKESVPSTEEQVDAPAEVITTGVLSDYERQKQQEYQEEKERMLERKREEDAYWEQKRLEREAEERRKKEEEASIRPIYEKYPEIYRFEILYWRAVSKPWWWNNYARELVEYASEYFPWNKVDYYSTYNSNSKGEDYNYGPFHDRIVSLRPKKRSKHPLVVINWDQEFIMVDSYYALQAMMDRIDAEWYRQYGFKKTYRNSPLTYKR